MQVPICILLYPHSQLFLHVYVYITTPAYIIYYFNYSDATTVACQEEVEGTQGGPQLGSFILPSPS